MIIRLAASLRQILPSQSDPISIVFITRSVIFIFGNFMSFFLTTYFLFKFFFLDKKSQKVVTNSEVKTSKKVKTSKTKYD